MADKSQMRIVMLSCLKFKAYKSWQGLFSVKNPCDKILLDCLPMIGEIIQLDNTFKRALKPQDSKWANIIIISKNNCRHSKIPINLIETQSNMKIYAYDYTLLLIIML